MRHPFAISLFCILIASSIAVADWPQVLGTNRDGRAAGETIEPWTQTPEIQWRASCGAGYAGVAVVDDKVLLWHRQDDQEHLDCLSTKDGQRIWRAEFPAVYRGGVDADRGPRCVPVVVDDQVFVYGAAGDLHAVSLDSGKTLWSRELRTQYNGDDGYFGAGSTPIVVGDLVIVAVGGEDGAGVVAVNKQSGKTVWKAVDQEAAYSSPVVINVNGQPRVLVVMRLKTAMLDPASGEVLGEFDFGQRGPTVNAATPLVDGSKLFVTASYGVGCRMIDMANSPTKNLWANEDVISSQYVTPVRHGDWLFAITGREDFGNGELLCARWSDGKVAWQESGFGTAHLIAVGTHVLAQQIQGRLQLFAADETSYRELAKTELPTGSYRAMPAMSDGMLYCRRILSPTENELLAIKIAN